MRGLPTWSINEDVYIGFWINSSLGSLRGATITLDRQAGGIVIAFVALFVASTTPSLWKMFCFAVHMITSSSQANDGFHHQRQAILRNRTVPTDALLDLARLGHTWRANSWRTYRRTFPIAFVAFSISIASLTIGLLSSKLVVQGNNEVLISGRNCVSIRNETHQLSLELEAVMLYQSQSAANAFTYAAQCYQMASATPTYQCQTFMTPDLPYRIDRNASCPFSVDVCKSDVGNIMLDSGPLYSSTHFGLDASPRFTLQHRTHCVPLKIDGFTSVFPATNGSRPLRLYHYGTLRGRGAEKAYLYATQLDRPAPKFDEFAIGNYRIIPMWAIGQGAGSNIDLIPQLKVSHAITSVLFLDSSEVLYAESTDDPWFAAKIREPMPFSSRFSKRYSRLLNSQY